MRRNEGRACDAKLCLLQRAQISTLCPKTLELDPKHKLRIGAELASLTNAARF